MPDIALWLLLIALLLLAIQGAQWGAALANFGQRLKVILVMIALPLVLAITLVDSVAAQSLVAWSELAQSQQQGLLIVLLLEAALVCSAGVRWFPLGSTLGFVFGLLYLLQSGVVVGEFMLQGAIYASAIALLLLVSAFLAYKEPRWQATLFISLVLISIVLEARTATATTAAFDGAEMLISLSTLMLLLFVGALYHYVSLTLSNKFN